MSSPTRRYPTSLRFVLGVISLLLILTYWGAVLARPATAARHASAARTWPFTLNGTIIGNLDAFSTFVDGSGQDRWSKPLRVFLLTSDLCRYSHQEVDAWKVFIRSSPSLRSMHLTILSTNGLEIPQALSREALSAGVSHEVRLITDRARYVGATGLAGTPRTLITDSDARVRLSIPRMTDRNRRILEEFVPDFRASRFSSLAQER